MTHTNQIAATLLAGKPVAVVNPDNGLRFTISPRRYHGLRGYGIIPDGKVRPLKKHGHMILSEARLREWVGELVSREQSP